jgi:hypothetical protein
VSQYNRSRRDRLTEIRRTRLRGPDPAAASMYDGGFLLRQGRLPLGGERLQGSLYARMGGGDPGVPLRCQMRQHGTNVGIQRGKSGWTEIRAAVRPTALGAIRAY